MRRLGYASSTDSSSTTSTLDEGPPLRVGDAEALLARDRRPAARRARRPGRRARGAVRAGAPLGSACRPPPLLRPHRQPEHVRRRARRRGRGGRQRVHRVVDRRVGPVGGRADRASTGCASWCGMPERTAGVLTSGGSLASLTAFAAAREARLGGPAGPASSTSPTRRTRRCRAPWRCSASARAVLASDAGQRLEPAGAAGRRRGGPPRPGCSRSASSRPRARRARARSIRCASCTPRARELGLWLHVDGAYGAPAALTEAGAAALDGLGLADSLVVDPHKWLFQPYEIGCVLVREPGLLERVFSLEGAYLRDTGGGAGGLPRPRPRAHARRPRPEAVAVGARRSGSTRSARRSRTGSRSPSTPRRGCASATAGRSSRPPRSASSPSAAPASTTTPTRGCRPRRSRTATPRRARPSSAAASSCGCARSTRARRSRRSTRRST